MAVKFEFEADISQLTDAIGKLQTSLEGLNKKSSESKQKLADVFTNPGSNQLLDNIRKQNSELDREKQALNDLNKYMKVLEATQKQTFDPNAVSKMNSEIAKTKLAIDELTKKSGKKLEILDQLQQVPNAGNAATNAIQGIGLAIASVVSLKGLSDLALQSVRVAASFENTRVSFETMLGSGQKATELLSQLVREAAVTPFELKDLTEIGQRLLAMGIAADQLVPTIRVLGDIGAGVGTEKLPQLTLALGQVRAAGKLTGNELRQFTEAGVPLLEALAEKGGKSVKILAKEVTDGKIGFDEVNAALAGLTEQGGKFFGLMNKQSQTLTGLTSTLKDDFNSLLRSVGEGINEGLKEAVKSADGFVKTLDPEKLRGFGRAIGEIIGFLAKFIGLIVPLGAGIAAATTGVTALTVGARLLGITLTASTGPIGLVIFGLTSLVTLTAQYVLQAEKLGAVEGKLADIRNASIDQIRSEKRESDFLFETIRNVNTSKEQKAKAIEKILALYPEYLKGIDTNKELLNNLDLAQQRVNEGLIDYVVNQQAAKTIQTELEKQFQSQLELKSAQAQLFKAQNEANQSISKAEELYGAAADEGVKAAQKRIQNITNDINQQKEVIKSVGENSAAIKGAIKGTLAGIDLNPEITGLTQEVQIIESNIAALRIKINSSIGQQKTQFETELKQVEIQLTNKQKQLSGLINRGLKDTKSADTGKDTAVADAQKRAKELNDAEKRIRDIRAQLIINDAEREKQIEQNKYDDLIKQIREFGAKAGKSREEIQSIEASALIKHKLALIDIEAKYQLRQLNQDAGKDKVRIAQNELDIERQSFEKRLAVQGLSLKNIEELTKEHFAKQIVLLANYVAETEKRDEEANTKRLERLKLINEATGNERAKELLDLEESFKKQSKLVGSTFDTEEGAKIYEKSRMIFTEKKAEINRKFDQIDLDNELAPLVSQQDYRKKIYEEQYQQQIIAIDQLNVAEDKKNELRSELDRKRKIFELELERDFLFAKLNAGESLNDQDKKLIEERIKTITAGIGQLQQVTAPKGGQKANNIFELFGLDSDTANQLQGLYNEANKIANDYLNAEAERAARAKEIADQKVSDLENQLNQELDLKNQGYANNYDLVQKQLDDAKISQAKALEERKKAAKAQLALDSATQVSNMVLAASNLYKTWSSIPFGLGLIAAAAQVAGLFALIASVKNRAAAINAGQFEEGGAVDMETGVIRGKRHSQGGVKMYFEAEEGEFFGSDGKRMNIVNRKMTRKHFDLLTAINKDDRFAMAQSLADLTGGMQLNIDREVPQKGNVTINNSQNLSVTEIREIRDILKNSFGNKTQIYDDGKVRIERNGNTTRTIRKH